MWLVVNASNSIEEALSKYLSAVKFLDQVQEHEFYFKNISESLKVGQDEIMMLWFVTIILKGVGK